jgi:hypothetical protein
MDFFWILVLIISCFFSIKELKNSKRLPNDKIYNFYQNSRYYRLLFITIAIVILIVLVIIRKLLGFYNYY